MSNYDQAMYWLAEADEKTLPEAGRECLMAATAHALLAIADAVRDRCDRCAALRYDQGHCGGDA